MLPPHPPDYDPEDPWERQRQDGTYFIGWPVRSCFAPTVIIALACIALLFWH